MEQRLDGRIALVTGAGTGIGRAAALRLARAGAKVMVNYYRSREQAEQVVAEIRGFGGSADLCGADVTKLGEIDRLAADTEQRFGGEIEILVNNAGHLIRRCLNREMEEALYDEIMDLNVKSTVFLSKRVIPGMMKLGRGAIINMSSVAAHNGGGEGSSVYAASKAAVISYSKGLAKELAAFGIRVNSVSPGYIGNTNFHSRVTSEAARTAAIQGIPLKRQGEPEDVAEAILFLAADASRFITGETIEINGGAFMR